MRLEPPRMQWTSASRLGLSSPIMGAARKLISLSLSLTLEAQLSNIIILLNLNFYSSFICEIQDEESFCQIFWANSIGFCQIFWPIQDEESFLPNLLK
ncbi:hypothetical protein L1987_18570 [Smallanthus sonchifolius]|uniref:Uncharacterized protein n=1 Tax=Smallanthus sonchifolius TaxID=185202 RepID=A0ACB9J235_9ASTR|nr:hypothetical protein L1987_18570 [Smallanthus sonchifolius]